MNEHKSEREKDNKYLKKKSRNENKNIMKKNHQKIILKILELLSDAIFIVIVACLPMSKAFCVTTILTFFFC